MAKEKEERESTVTPLAEPDTAKKSKIVKRNADGAPVRYEIAEEERCLLCGKNRKTKTTDYCTKCLEKLKKKKPPVLGWFVTVGFVAVVAVAFVLGFMNYAPGNLIVKGKIALAEMRLNDSGEAFGEALSVVDELNTELGHELIFIGKGFYIDFSKTAGNPLDMAQIASQYLTEQQIAGDKELAAAKKELADYQAALQLVQDILSAVQEGTMEPDDAVAAIQKLEPDNEQYMMWLLYYESYVKITFDNQDYLDQLEYLQKIEKLNPDCGWFYDNMIRNDLYSLGRYDECLVYCDREIEANRNAVDAYLAKLRIAMMNRDEEAAKKVIADFEAYNDNSETVAVMKVSYERVFGSLENAIEICDSAAGSGTSNAEFNRQLAINYLAQNNYTAAFEAAYNAYATAYSNYSQYGDSTALTTSLFETVYVCTRMYDELGNGDSQYDADVASILDGFAGYDGQISDISRSILSGEVDPAEALTKGTGDLI